MSLDPCKKRFGSVRPDRWVATGQWTADSIESAARVIGAQLFPTGWDDLKPRERAQCRRTASTALGAAIVAVQKNDFERTQRGLSVRTGFVSGARG